MLKTKLGKEGFEVFNDETGTIIKKIKRIIFEHIHCEDNNSLIRTDLSDLIEKRIGRN